MNMPTSIVSTDWLKAEIGAPDLKLVDGTWFLDGGAAKGFESYQRAHIRGAVFFDIDEIAETKTDLPHMVPTTAQFENAVGRLSITQTDRVVVYDQQGLFSAARVWWTFLAMGHQAVAVLNGGLPAWVAAGGLVTDQSTSPKKVPYQATLDSTVIATVDDVRKGDRQLFDARPSPRFLGTAQEPRPGLLSGAMPNAKNIPSTDLVDNEGFLKDKTTLNGFFNNAGLDEREIITTCGSGVTAAILALALRHIGRNNWRLYDGSWAEWGKASNDRALYPVMKKTE